MTPITLFVIIIIAFLLYALHTHYEADRLDQFREDMNRAAAEPYAAQARKDPDNIRRYYRQYTDVYHTNHASFELFQHFVDTPEN